MSLLGLLLRGFGPTTTGGGSDPPPSNPPATNSAISKFERDTITVFTEAVTSGDSFGVNEEYVDAGTKRCLVQQMGAREILDYQVRGMAVDHKLYFSADPELGLNTLLQHGNNHLRVQGTFHQGRPGQILLWIVIAKQVTSRDER